MEHVAFYCCCCGFTRRMIPCRGSSSREQRAADDMSNDAYHSPYRAPNTHSINAVGIGGEMARTPTYHNEGHRAAAQQTRRSTCGVTKDFSIFQIFRGDFVTVQSIIQQSRRTAVTKPQAFCLVRQARTACSRGCHARPQPRS